MKALEKKKECFKMNDDVESEASQADNLVHIRSHLKRMIKKLILLKMLKSQNRRIKWLCELAHKYRNMLALKDALDIPTSPAGTSITSEDPPKPKEDATAEPVMDIEEITIDKEVEACSSAETSVEAPSPELHEALCLKGLPQRLKMPAPRRLCRPSALRWIKPCCTRSCNETL